MSKYNNLFEGIDLSQYTPEQIMESKKVYDYIVEANEIAKQEGVPFEEVMDEGLFSALVGGAVGSTVGQSISATLRNNDGVREKSYKVAADIVRVQDWNNDKILIGAKFKNDDRNVKSIVAECQRKELRVRKLNNL